MNGVLPAAPDHAPIGGGEFARLIAPLGPFEARPKLAVGVSGGADSTALAHLTDDWAAGLGGEIVALVVDHGLRPEAGAEAEAVVRHLRLAGIAGRVLRWTGPKPVTGIQAAARDARRALLGEACRDLGILHLLLAHHADDQDETVTLRRAAGSGAMGLAGMAPVVETGGLRVLRPLLPVRRGRLEATLRARGAVWIDDPSNRDQRFARARLRAGGAGEPNTSAPADVRARVERAAAAFLAEHLHPQPQGYARLTAAALDGSAAAEAALSGLLTCIGGRRYPPSARLLARLRDWDGRRRSLAGCTLHRVGAWVEILREAGRIVDVVDGWCGDPLVWDGRWWLSAEAPHRGLTVRTVGAAAPSIERPRMVPAAAIAALPGLWYGDRLVACPPMAWCAGLERWRGTAVLQARVPAAPAPFPALNVVSNATGLI